MLEVVAIVSAIISVAAALSAALQWRVMRKAAQSDVLRQVMREINDPSFRQARRTAYSIESGRPIEDWSEGERLSADIICAKYSEIGFLAKNRFIATEAFVRHYGGQFIRTYRKLSEYVDRERQRFNSPNQYVYFEWLARNSYIELTKANHVDWWEGGEWRNLQMRTGDMRELR